jgi:hypothetical protein
VSPERALALVLHRERALALVLEDERDQGWPKPFDWHAWRRNRAEVVAKLRSHTYWSEKAHRVIHRLGTDG